MALPIQLIQRAALTAEHLSPHDQVLLASALLMASHGAEITIAAIYSKVVDCPARVAGEDYQPLPFAPPTAHLGVIRKVAVNKDGDLYFLVHDQARGDGGSPEGWTSMRPAGVRSFQIRGMR